MLLFDIGANRGDATYAGLNKGFDKIIAIEAAPKIYTVLASNFLYNASVIPLKYAVSDADYQNIKFYEAEEDGLSTMNLDWLTNETMPYAGKPYRTVEATTITIDTLVKNYGVPDLIKVDVEGAEWAVFRGMTQKYGMITFEWTVNTLDEHQKQLEYLRDLGYTEYAPQYIVNHLDEPKSDDWVSLNDMEKDSLSLWIASTAEWWEDGGGWEKAGLRPTADVGMIWVR